MAPCRQDDEPPCSRRAVETTSHRFAVPPGRYAEPPSRRAVPSSRKAIVPSSRYAVEPLSLLKHGTAEPPCRRASELPCRRAVETPGRRAAEVGGLIRGMLGVQPVAEVGLGEIGGTQGVGRR